MKTCIKCAFVGEEIQFRKDRNMCLVCLSKYKKQYYLDNREVLLEKKKQYGAENKKIIQERNK